MNSIDVMNKAADNIRCLALSMVERAKSGHPGGALGGADFINVLFSEYLRFDPDCPGRWARDRFFLAVTTRSVFRNRSSSLKSTSTLSTACSV